MVIGEKIWIGNGQTCWVAHCWDVRIKMYDECERVFSLDLEELDFSKHP